MKDKKQSASLAQVVDVERLIGGFEVESPRHSTVGYEQSLNRSKRPVRLSTTCPFCYSERDFDSTLKMTRFYKCGTRVNQTGSPIYDKRCD